MPLLISSLFVTGHPYVMTIITGNLFMVISSGLPHQAWSMSPSPICPTSSLSEKGCKCKSAQTKKLKIWNDNWFVSKHQCILCTTVDHLTCGLSWNSQSTTWCICPSWPKISISIIDPCGERILSFSDSSNQPFKLVSFLVAFIKRQRAPWENCL